MVDHDDRCIERPWFDGGSFYHHITLYSMLLFDAQLDAEKLRTSLQKLVTRDGYWKLTARFGRNETTSDLDYRIPRRFAEDRPAITFTHKHHDMPAAAHPVGASVPKPSQVPEVVGRGKDLLDLMRGGVQDRPLTLNDYLETDRSMLSVHVTTFHDMTSVGMISPHSAWDAIGTHIISKNWVVELEGREKDIETPRGFDLDPLADHGRNKDFQEPWALADKRLDMDVPGGGALAAVASSVPNHNDMRCVCVPASFWKGEKKRAEAELAVEALNRGEEKTPFIIKGDIIYSWFFRLLVSSYAAVKKLEDLDFTVATQQALSLRKLLQDTLSKPADGPYIGQASSFVAMLHPARDILNKPLSCLALEIRRALQRQGTHAQTKAYAKLQRAYGPEMRTAVCFGEKGEGGETYVPTCSNWQQARFFEVDFKAAAREPELRESSTPLRPVFVQCYQEQAYSEGWPICGKDSDGNHWIQGVRETVLWDELERQLDEQNKLASKESGNWVKFT